MGTDGLTRSENVHLTRRKKAVEPKVSLSLLRSAVADYIKSEGCGCCANYEQHQKDKRWLGRLLRVPKYPDDSGYDFSRFESKD